MNNVEQLLRSLGITSCYEGYKQAVYYIKLAVEDGFRLTAVVKELY